MEWINSGKEWLLTKGPDFVMNLVVFLLILIVGAIVIATIKRIVARLLKASQRINETLERFFVNVLGKVMWVVLMMIALPRLGIDIAPLIAGLGVTGFIVGFAFQESLGNLAAGLMIILNRPYEVGDFVTVAGHSGAVKEINMMATMLATPDNRKITIPNSSIWGGPVENFTCNPTRRVDLTVGVSYDADLNQAKQVIESVVKGIGLVHEEPAPVIEVAELADSSVNFVVRQWTNTADYWTVFFALQKGIKEALDAASIGIPYPQMDVHHHGLGSGNPTGA